MAARIHLATEASEIDAALRLRHQVYVDQGRYIAPSRGGRILDRYDAYPGVRTFLARVGDRIVGTSRLIIDTGAGTHVDEYMDFSPYVPAGARIGSGSMLCVHEDYRRSHGLAMALVGMCIQHAVAHGLTHLFGAVNPEALPGFVSAGFEPLGHERLHEEKGLRFVPVRLDLAETSERIRTFVRRMDGVRLVRSSERLFLDDGDVLIREDEPGTEAFLILDGTVLLTAGGEPVATLRRGAWLGELAALLDRPRSATATAVGECDLLVVSRQLLLSEARRDPEVALDLLRQVADRLWDSTHRPVRPT